MEEQNLPVIQPDTPVQTVDVPESNAGRPVLADSSPFEAPAEGEGSPFGELNVIDQPTTKDNVATPMRTMTAAIANTDVNTVGPDDVIAAISKNLESSQQLIDSGQERQMRVESATRQILERDRALRDMPNYAGPITPELGNAIHDALVYNRNRQLQEEQHAALEKEAIDKAISLYNAGDEVGYRMMANQLDPNKASVTGVTADLATKSLIINNAIERAGLANEEEPFWHKFLTGVISIPEAVLLGGMFEKLGNVDKGVGGYDPSFWRWLNPGTEMGSQIEALRSLSHEELAKAMPKFLENIKSNSTTLGLTDPGRQERILTEFRDGLTNTDQIMGNVMNWADIGGILPIGKIGNVAMRGSEMLTSLGARKAAANRVAMAIEATSKGGEGFALKTTAAAQDEIVEHSLPTALNPLRPAPLTGKAALLSGASKITGIERVHVPLVAGVNDTMAAAREVTEALRPMTDSTRFLDPVERANAIQAVRDKLESTTGESIADYDVVNVPLANGSATTRINAVINKPFATEAEARGWLMENAYPSGEENVLFKSELVQDTSGAFFPRVSVDMPETSFYTSNLNPPRASALSRLLGGRYWKNASNLSDSRLFGQMVEADTRRAKLLQDVNKNMLEPFRKMNSNDRIMLTEVLKKGDRMQKWFKESEFNTIWERATGKVPSDEVQAAYRQYKVNNDVEHMMRNADMYAAKVVRGYESVQFQPLGKGVDIDAIVQRENLTHNGRVFDASEGVHYNKHNPLTPERLKQLEQQGYVMLKTEQTIKLADNTYIDQFLVKKTDVEVSNLRRNQLGYREGGHRVYTDKYFVKQPRVGKQGDTGEEFFDSPNTYVTAPTLNEAKKWADTMELARREYNAGKSAQWLDENIFKGRERGFPSGEEFVEGMKSGHFNPNYAFEPLFDRELPSIYRGKGDLSKFLEDEVHSRSSFFRTTGRMYYSTKGETLRAFNGDFAPTLDPFETQAKGLYNVAQLSSFNDFKMNSIQRWVNTYKDELNGYDPESVVATFNNATVKDGAPQAIRDQIIAQRDSIQRALGYRTDFDRGRHDWLRGVSEWIGGESDSKFRKSLAKAPIWYMDKSPVSFLRGFASDMKLGMFNIGQFPIQVSTAFSATALSPKFGMMGWATGPSVEAYFYALKHLGKDGAENVLEKLAKGNMRKLGGFGTEQEFKEYVRHAVDSGFFNLGETHQMVNAAGPESTFALQNGIEKTREMGRFFFYKAEATNRQVAYRIAYGEAIEKFGKRPFSDAQFRQYIAARAENYSFNMSNAAKASFQQGVLSIPTQFWAYNVRMLEALTGGNFTGPQKIRLLAAQMGLAGTGGVPVVAGVMSYINGQVGHAPDIQSPNFYEKMYATTQRGLLDLAVSELTGADVKIGEKYGTGEWSTQLVEDIFGSSAYGQKSVAEMLAGPTAAILGPVLMAPITVAQVWSAHESGGEPVDLTSDEWMKMFRGISSINNIAFKARLAHEYGIYQSGKGNTIIDGLPKADAVFLAMGFAPGEMADIEAMSIHGKERQKSIQDAANWINSKLQDGINRPDEFEQNAKQVNAFVNLVPIDIRREVLMKAHLSRDKSLYSKLLRQGQKEDMLESYITEETDNGEAN